MYHFSGPCSGETGRSAVSPLRPTAAPQNVRAVGSRSVLLVLVLVLRTPLVEEELPAERQSRYWAFLAGGLAYTAFLVTLP